jgi:hypothetical protein
VKGSVLSETKEETTHRVEAINVGALTNLETFGRNIELTETFGTSGLEERAAGAVAK